MTNSQKIPGYCLFGCGQRLSIDTDGVIRCECRDCPMPNAYSRLMVVEAAEHDHIVTYVDGNPTVKHPLWERLIGDVTTCGITHYFKKDADMPDGMYRGTVQFKGTKMEYCKLEIINKKINNSGEEKI